MSGKNKAILIIIISLIPALAILAISNKYVSQIVLIKLGMIVLVSFIFVVSLLYKYMNRQENK